MLRFEPGPERAKLGFRGAVLSAFGFLENDYGFRCVKTEVTLVRYESDRVFVNVYHGRGSYFMDVEIGPLSGNPEMEERFSLRHVLKLAAALETTGYTEYQVSHAEHVKEFVDKLAELTKIYAGDVLRGQPKVFEQLRALQTSESDALTKSWHFNDIRRQAEIAWRSKDYATLVKLFESIRADLSPSEVAKLEYAKKQQRQK